MTFYLLTMHLYVYWYISECIYTPDNYKFTYRRRYGHFFFGRHKFVSKQIVKNY